MTDRRWRFPLFVSGLVLLSQAFPLPSPVRDAATLQWVDGFTLKYPLWHLVFTPFCGLADALTVLSYHQAIVTAVGVFALFFLLGGLRQGLKLSVLFLGFAAWAAAVPRPMGKLVAADATVLLIDFHSHTQYSHDGRSSFTPADNMLWHRGQGYHAAFITDHNLSEASRQAKEESRHDWKETEYRSLEGEEVSLYKTHLVLLGNHTVVDNRPYDSDPSKIHVFLADMSKRGLPVVASLPEYWWYHWGEDVNNFVKWGVKGFEIINSAPRAMDFPISKRLEVVDLCRRHNLFMTGISDTHGYGYATAVWNAMPLPDWQSMDPDRLEKTVLEALKTNGFRAVQVLERIRFTPETVWGLLLSPLGTFWLYWRSLQPFQAISWVLWIYLSSCIIIYGPKA